MQIRLAKTAGFCFGVERAVALAEQTAQSGVPAVTLGPIIHNRHVVERFERMGLREIAQADEAQPGQTVIISAHGIPVAEQRLLAEHTGVTPTAFAYPYGAMCADAAEVIRSMGFRATLSCESRVCRITHDPECLTALGRYLRPAGVDSRTYFDRIDAAVAEACKK